MIGEERGEGLNARGTAKPKSEIRKFKIRPWTLWPPYSWLEAASRLYTHRASRAYTILDQDYGLPISRCIFSTSISIYQQLANHPFLL